jgi:hypothetical protein
MPLPTSLKLFIEPSLGVAYSSFNGSSQVTKPSLFLGDKAQVEVYLVQDTNVASYPRQEVDYPVGLAIKVAVGEIDASPTSGTFRLSFGGDVTSALAFNATATVVQTALNALASITSAGGVVVAKVGDNYSIAFNNNGARTDITADSSGLIPLSTAGISPLQVGDSTHPQITLVHLQQTVAAFANSFTQVSSCAITVTALSAWDSTRATYRVSISPDPKGGTFTLAFDSLAGVDVSTKTIAVGATALEVQNALDANALDDKVTVQQVGAYAYDITVTDQPGTLGLTANGSGLLSFKGYKGELNLNTAEAISLLDGAESFETTLEVEVTSDSKPLTVLQIPCTLKSSVVDEAAIEPLVLETPISQTTADGRYLRLSNNLSDLPVVGTARTNLNVYSTTQVDTALALKANTSHTQAISTVTGLQTALDAKAALSGASFSGTVYTPSIRNLLNTDLVIDSYNDTGAGTHYLHKFTPFDGKLVLATNGGGLTFPDGTTQATAATTPNLTPYALLAGATFTGKVNTLSPTSTNAGLNIGSINSTANLTNSVAGDVWIGTWQMAYKTANGTLVYGAATNASNVFGSPQVIDTTASTPGLRITQKGTGFAIRIEDETTPDTSATIIDNSGKVGIQIDPSAIALTEALTVGGNIVASNIKCLAGSGSAFYFQSGNYLYDIGGVGSSPFSGNLSSSDYPIEIEIQANGTSFKVPARYTYP